MLANLYRSLIRGHWLHSPPPSPTRVEISKPRLPQSLIFFPQHFSGSGPTRGKGPHPEPFPVLAPSPSTMHPSVSRVTPATTAVVTSSHSCPQLIVLRRQGLCAGPRVTLSIPCLWPGLTLSPPSVLRGSMAQNGLRGEPRSEAPLYHFLGL